MQADTHEPVPEHEPGPAVLDLGADVGAAVVYTTAALDGAEIEIRPRGGSWDGTHTAVRRRPGGIPGQPPIFAALFHTLKAGAYELRPRGGHLPSRTRSIEVVGGCVTEQNL